MLPAGGNEINTLQLIDTNILTKVWGDMPKNKTDKKKTDKVQT